MSHKKTISVTEAAKLRGITRTSILQLLMAGRLPSAKKVGRMWQIDLAELERYYEALDAWREFHRKPEEARL